VIVGATQRGLCWLSLAGTKDEAEASLREEFHAATLKRDPSLATMVEAALRVVGVATNPTEKLAAPQVDLRGTAFQLKVWQALRRIPRGETRSYSQLAREMGKSRGDCGSMPSRGGRERLSDRLSLGRGTEADAAGSRRRKALTVTAGRTATA
jgi:O6-methylguanine-DNA--protein-cysteine methyltransferase